MRPLAKLATAALLVVGALPAVAADEAGAPAVVATIGPLHSLASAVMQGVGAPSLLVPGGASPHAYSLRPSEAGSLQEADLIVWVGPQLERFLEEGLESLAKGTRQVEVLAIDGLHLRAPREGGTWEAHDHEAEGEGHHHEPDHESEHGHESDHDHAHDHDHGPAGARADPHVWLDPHNAEMIVEAIATALAEIDADRAETYWANAVRIVQELEELETALKAKLVPVAGRPFIVFHDAYGYFEESFGLSAVGSVTVSPEQPPSARRVAELRRRIEALGAVCLFREPQFAPRLVETIAEGTGARIGVLDPLGSDLVPGPRAYPMLLTDLADSLVECLDETG